MLTMLDIMTPNVVTIHASDTLATACNVMDSAKTRHLFVVNADGSLVGVVSDRDCKLALQSPFAGEGIKAAKFAEKILVERIMTKMPHCVSPQTYVQEAAQIMLENRINSLPVMRDGTLIGIVTTTDLLKVLATAEVL